MIISFADENIENWCRQTKLATKKLGAESAKKLQKRISECFAASSVSELVAGRPHPLSHCMAGQFALDLYRGHRLIFKPTNVPPPTKDDGSIDWSQVTEITIIETEDYHD